LPLTARPSSTFTNSSTLSAPKNQKSPVSLDSAVPVPTPVWPWKSRQPTSTAKRLSPRQSRVAFGTQRLFAATSKRSATSGGGDAAPAARASRRNAEAPRGPNAAVSPMLASRPAGLK